MEPTDAPIEDVPTEEPQLGAGPAKPTPAVRVIRDVCETCMRPITDVYGPWKHIDARFDIEGAHPAVLFVEPPVAWGFQGTKGKSDFTVKAGPSKVHSGWSGGGVA
jgi:hypothetical protein